MDVMLQQLREAAQLMFGLLRLRGAPLQKFSVAASAYRQRRIIFGGGGCTKAAYLMVGLWRP